MMDPSLLSDRAAQQQKQREAEKLRYTKALQGWLTDLPPEESHSIRIFFSSTFTDMTAERNVLFKEAVPYLRDYCKDKELDFQVVDMRWGVREDASVEHMTTELCLREIVNCQQTSKGPNFVAFLGDRYGSRTLPTTIPVTEYRTLRRLASWMDESFKAVNRWYLVDTNAIPPVYRIQPITAILPAYNETDPEKRILRQQHRQEWERDQANIMAVFHKVSTMAHSRKMLSDEAFTKYYISVTHDEVLQGMARATDVQNKVLSFHRTLTDINLEDALAKRFTDLTEEGELDEEAKELRTALKTETVPKYLPSDNIVENSVNWTSNGIDESNPDHAAYLRTFSDTFTAKIMEMIDKSCEKTTKKQETIQLDEVLIHLRFCQEKCETFFGRDTVLHQIYSNLGKVEAAELPEAAEEQVELKNHMREKSDLRGQREKELAGISQFVQQTGSTFCYGDAYDDFESDPDRNVQEENVNLPRMANMKFKQPTVIHGESGSGKTALMAKIAQISKRWLPDSYCIIRFMGATPASSGIRQVLISIIVHIVKLYEVPLPGGIDLTVDFHYLVMFFNALLWRIDTAAHPLFILFDSVDQLDSTDYAHSLTWLPKMVPSNVHIFISMADDHPTCLPNMRLLLPSDIHYIKLGPLDSASADKMIRCVCHQAGRTLTAWQRKLLLQKFENNPQALYLRMITDQSLTWRSHQKTKTLTVADSVEGAINQLFDELEKDHGAVTVAHAMAFLTRSRTGISDAEMEDLLSLDDEVLQDTYIYHLPPDPQQVRFPTSIWVQIKNDLGDYLAKNQVGKLTIYYWYHRHFFEAAKERYTTGEHRETIQKILAEYFLGTWSSQPKPLELTKGKKGSYPDCYRGVPAQPLTFGKIYNMRKLMELPCHLAASDDWANFYRTVCTVEWMVAACQTVGLTTLLSQMQAMLDRQTDELDKDTRRKVKDIQFILDMLKLGADTIRRDPMNLPVQIIGQLGPNYKGPSSIRWLMKECLAYLEKSEHALLVPRCACMPAPGGLLLCSVNINMFLIGADRTLGHNMCVDEDSKHLYVIEMASAKPDSLLCVDYENTCSIVAHERLPFHVHSICFAGGQRFLVMKVYEKLSKFDPVFHYMMFGRSLSSPFKFEKHVVALSVDSHGQSVAFAYKDEARVHIGTPDTSTRTILVKQHVSTEAPVSVVLFSPSGSDVVMVDSKHNMMVWNEAQRLVSPRPSDKTKFLFSKPNPDSYRITKSNLLLVAVEEGMDKVGLKVTDLITMQDKHFLTSDQLHYKISIIELDDKEEFVLGASKEDSIVNGIRSKPCLMWRLSSGSVTCTLHSNSPWQAVRLIGDEYLTCITSCSDKGVIQILNLGPRDYPYPEGHLVCELNQHSRKLFGFVTVKDNSLLLSAGTDNTLKAWDLGRILREFDPEEKQAVLLSQRQKKDEGKEKTVLAGQGTVDDLGKTSCIVTTKTPDCAVYFGTDSGKVAYSMLNSDGSVGDPVQLTSDLPPLNLMIMSMKGDYVIAAAENTIAVFDVKSAKLKYTRPSISGRRRVDCLAEGGGTAIAGHSGMEGKGLIFDVATGETIKAVEMLYSFSQTAVSRSGLKVVVHMFEFPIVMDVYDMGQEEQQMGVRMDQLDIMMTGCVFMGVSPNDMYVVACAADGSIRVVSMENKYLHRMQQRSSAICATFTPDSMQLVTAGYRSMYIWRMGSGQLDFKLTRHQDFVTSLQFSSDGRFLVSTSLDRTILVWDFRTRTTISVMHVHCQLHTAAVTPDLSSVVYVPERVASLAVFQPNAELWQILSEGRELRDVSEEMEQAQACALAFSSQRIQKVTSSACVIV